VIHKLHNVLTDDLRRRLLDVARTARLDDGRTTNPVAAQKKHNLQLVSDHEHSVEVGRLVHQALVSHPGFPSLLVRHTTVPRLVVYRPDMRYGQHLDEAVWVGNPMVRADWAVTLFVSHPDDYQGGELTVIAGDQSYTFKENAGTAVFYPSGQPHRVDPVASGERVVCVMWMQSLVRDHTARAVLMALHRAIESLTHGGAGAEVLNDLNFVRINVTRMWVEF